MNMLQRVEVLQTTGNKAIGQPIYTIQTGPLPEHTGPAGWPTAQLW